ncbi:MAG: methyl-accepting chemotaxis protein [Verrucomicrobiota bacterium]|jgi:methyl-accepting chemotaxis protein
MKKWTIGNRIAALLAAATGIIVLFAISFWMGLEQISRRFDLIASQAAPELAAAAHNGAQFVSTIETALFIILPLAVLLTLVIGTFVTRSISLGLRRPVADLSDGAEQTSAAAAQVSASSQTLAEGAATQAASLQETSASLEEIASMTKRNAANAQSTKDLADKAHNDADAGANDMLLMIQAMQEIKSSSDDIGKIIKTIDEIAFQTNILALNAAIEAAKAGEAGIGFAAVADEVRNLAQRSAQAAKETATKIETAISKTCQGVQMSRKVSESLAGIVSNVRLVNKLLAEIATASREQSEGINQVNEAVAKMDNVVQSNAASALESSSAAQEMNAHAQVLRGIVEELQSLTGTSPAAPSKSAPGWTIEKARTNSTRQAPGTRHNGQGRAAAAPTPAGAWQRKPSDLPLEAGFKDF